MLQSMTGWGKAQFENSSKKVTVELKCLNSKQLDLNIKMPPVYREREADMRTEISASLIRGKIDLYINLEYLESASAASLNQAVLKQYFEQVRNAGTEMGIQTGERTLSALLRLPDVFHYPVQEADEKEWEQLLSTLRKAIQEVLRFRNQEGESLSADILQRIQWIGSSIPQLEVLEPARVEKYKARLKNNLNGVSLKDKFDENRFEQELIYYLEKIDITEEKVRLRNHLDFFVDTMNKEEFPGKKLGFIAQEIGREINTIGSKANDSDMQKIVVGMKDELEKIREQLMNIL